MTKRDKNILVTGGAGYIGSHMVRLLKEKGYTPVVFDNLSTGHKQLIPKGVRFIKGDVRKSADLKKAFKRADYHAAIHFAGLIAVGESVRKPRLYYDNNVKGSLELLKMIEAHHVPFLIFSSTAAVYGPTRKVKIPETGRLKPQSPYGENKLAIERAIRDMAKATGVRYASLRYFNACGAHPSCQTGEWHEPETHLIPNVIFSLLDKRPFKAFGQDYPTRDGTCIRDYIHVLDLCAGHLAALKALEKGKPSGAYNLGTGQGRSVLEVVRAVEKVAGKKVDLRFVSRRAGDAANLVADPSLARRVFGWKAKHGLKDIVASAWAWEKVRRRRFKG